MDFLGKRVWLTGGSSGIGLALAKQLLSKGAKVAISARGADRLNEVVSSLPSEIAGNVYAFPLDVAKPDEALKVGTEIACLLGGIDMLISNAGVYTESWPESFNSSQYKEIMNVNFYGMLHCIEAVLPHMLQANGGTIVGIASLAGFRGLPRSAAYGASKAAQIHFLESIRFHLRLKGIRVVVVNPGFVKTPMTANNDFYMPGLVSPEVAVDYILRGLESNKGQIAFPWTFSRFLSLMRIIPFGIYDSLVDFIWRRMVKEKLKQQDLL